MEGRIVADPRPDPVAADATGFRRLIGVALAFIATGWALGFLVGMNSAPWPPSPGPGAARYMAGVQRMDGAAIWASISADFQAQAIRDGDSAASFAAFYRRMKERGNRIDQVQYVGGYQTREKGTFIYVTRRRDPGNDPLEINWVIVTGPDGLVDYVL